MRPPSLSHKARDRREPNHAGKLWGCLTAAISQVAIALTAQASPVVSSPWAGWTAAPPHPAVVRVIAAENNAMSLGSGTLVAVQGDHGLVVTNWHVVRDATGAVIVAFPDGFRSPATVLAADRDWDLAALAIWRPAAQAVPVARDAPRLGEPLSIAGYGSGQYRTASGRCTQYVSPGGNLPFEMVELSAAARQGDSGGPIFNQRGELAGVLFGAGFGTTAGSYCGRVRWFLDSVQDRFKALPPLPRQAPADGPMLAQKPTISPPQDPSSGPPHVLPAHQSPPMRSQMQPTQLVAVTEPAWRVPSEWRTSPDREPSGDPRSRRDRTRAQGRPPLLTAAIAAEPSPPVGANARLPRASDVARASEDEDAAAPPPVAAFQTPTVPSAPSAADTAGGWPDPKVVDNIRTGLAAVGLFFLVFHTLRLIKPTRRYRRRRARRRTYATFF